MNKDDHFKALLNKVAHSGDTPNEFMLSAFYLTGEDSFGSDHTLSSQAKAEAEAQDKVK